jgi:lysyl-tRNA synthetase class 2
MNEWRPDKLSQRLPRLQARGRLQAALRRWFAEQGFVEVETPILQRSPGAEVHLGGFSTEWVHPASKHPDHAVRWLHTSPEFAMKKLMAGGIPRLFQFARVFRNGEGSALHSPEFTMLEWYRADAGYEAVMADCAALLRITSEATGAKEFSWQGKVCDPSAEPERLTVAEAFRRHAAVDLFATVNGKGNGDAAGLAHAAGVRRHEDDTWSDVFFRVMFDRIEPHLGMGRPTILCEYPIAMAALARAKPGDAKVAERFELYCCGVELANAFGELTDAREQRMRLEADMAEKQTLYSVYWPIDDDFIAALEHGLPECAGIALGFDRLVMLATGAAHIEDVLWLPVR